MTAAKRPTRRRPAWKPGKAVTLRNASPQHILLDLPTGQQRLDTGRALRFTADVLNVPEVKKLVEAGQIVIED